MTSSKRIGGIAHAALLAIVLLASMAWARAPLDEIVVETNVRVPMRDGVALATDVYHPPRAGQAPEQRWPTILMRTPYDKLGAKADAEFFARHGYVFVVQDTRGRYASDGIWHMLADDGRDGFDTCQWIGRQSWSNGKLGTIGTSYVGGTQHALAMERPPQLVTSIPVDAMSNLGYQSMRNGGAFELRFWNWIYSIAGPHGSRQARDPATAAMLLEMKDRRRDYLVNLPLRRGTTPLKHLPEYEEWLVEALGHGTNDDFWKQNNILDHVDRYKDMPLYLVGGWYDSWAGNTTANFAALTLRDQGARVLDHGALDSRSARLIPSRASQLWRRCGHRRSVRLAFGMVRPLAKGGRQQRGQTGAVCHAGADLRDGKRRWRQNLRRVAKPRRPLARRTGVAAGARPGDALLPASRRKTFARQAHDGAEHDQPAIRSGPSRADDRRQYFLRRRHPAARRVGPARRTARVERPAADSALGAQRRARLPVRTARRGRGSDGRIGGESVDFLGRARHRLHGQAGRRVSAQCRLRGRVRSEYRRRDRADAISRISGAKP